jgi:hypothetical protein
VCKGNEPIWAGFTWVLTLRVRGGKNRKICDCAQSRRTTVSPFWATNLVGIWEGVSSLPRNRVDAFRVSGCGHVYSPFCSHTWYVRFPLSNTLLTRFLHRLESIGPPTTPRTLLGEAPRTHLCGADRSGSGLFQLVPPCVTGLVSKRNTWILWYPHIFTRIL